MYCPPSSGVYLFRNKTKHGEYQFYLMNSLMFIAQPMFTTYILAKGISPQGIAPNALYEDVIIMNVFIAYLMTPYLLFWGPFKRLAIMMDELECATRGNQNPSTDDNVV